MSVASSTTSSPAGLYAIRRGVVDLDAVSRVVREARVRPALALLVVLLATPASAGAQSGVTPPDGLYEDFPSIFMEPSVPLLATPTLLVRWVDVRTSAGITTVTFEPDARVVWRITWGPHGPDEKITLVDGEEWTRSRFVYDASGHLESKRVTGHGAEGGLVYAYETDARTGEIRTRTSTATTVARPSVERVLVTRTAHDVTVTLSRDGTAQRRDRYDAQHRLLETRFFDAHGTESARLSYVRDARGALRSVRRRLGPHRGATDPRHPDTTLSSSDVAALASAPIELHEARLLLGAPTLSTDEGRGVARAIRTDFAPSACWLDQISGLTFDATGLLGQATVGCICGFCVAASVPLGAGETERADGVETHWTAGPWVRLDGAIDVTADHELVTPRGARAAGDLAAGDVVTAADGSAHVLRSVERVAGEALRLGVNLTTPDGVFAAGGLRFVSETARACVP